MKTAHQYRLSPARTRKLRLESLEDRALLASLPAGFDQEVVAEGLIGPIAMTFAPDGRIFVAEYDGTLRVVNNSGVSPNPLGVIDSIDFGINGIATDPNFTTNGFLYIYYTHDVEPTPINRLSRFQISSTNPDAIDPDSETILLDNIAGGTANFHNGGFLAFGSDGYLYLGVGDGLEEALVQDLSSYHGKVLRIDPANYPDIIPPTNPFITEANALPAIWASGFRNPFSGAIHPVTGDIYINDVGSIFTEEVNLLQSGGNYGWPLREGIADESPFVDPIASYSHDEELGGSITGGAFYLGGNYPGDFLGDYFFGDYTLGFIKRMDPVTKEIIDFGDDLSTPVDLEIGPEGDLYWLSIEDGKIRRISYSLGNHPPEAYFDADPTSGLGPLTVHFNAVASEDSDGDPLTYSWDFGDGTTGSGIDVTHTYSVNGEYEVVLTVSDGVLADSTSPRTIIVGETVPNVSLLTPGVGTLYQAGSEIFFSGEAVDALGDPLPESAFEWSVVLHHRFHTHPFVPLVAGVKSRSFTIPTVGETDAIQFYRIHLKVTNSLGLSSSRFIDVLPKTSPLTLATNVPGLRLLLDSSPLTTPHSFVGVELMERELEAPLTYQLGDDTYEFERWSDEGPRIRTLITPEADNETLTAFYRLLPRQATISEAVNPVWYMGETRTYVVTVTNETTETWPATGEEAFKLAIYFGNPNLESGSASATLVELPEDLEQGMTASVTVTVTAPSNPGEFTLRHRMQNAAGIFLRGSAARNVDVSEFAAIYTSAPPIDWLTSTSQTYTITLTNTGAEAWRTDGSNPTHLGVYFGGESDAPNSWSQEPVRYALPHDVDAGESVTLEITVRAPSLAGNYVLRHRMVKEGVKWFQPLLKTAVTVEVAWDATYTASIPSVRAPGEAVTYSLQLSNTGSLPWNIDPPNEVHLGLYLNGNSDAIYDWPTEPQRFNLPENVASGETITIPITFSAPTLPGTYTLRQRMVKEGVSWFNALGKSTLQVGTFAATYDALLPARAEVSETSIISVTLTNTGTVPWLINDFEPLRLGYYFNPTDFSGPPAFVAATLLELPTNVLAGDSITLDVPVEMPADPGLYRLEMRLARGNFAWLDAALAQEVAVGARSAEYSANVPTVWWTEETQTVEVTITNSGSIPWPELGSQQVRLGYYFLAEGETEIPPIANPLFVNLPQNLAAGESVALSVPVTTPALAGSYRVVFRLALGSEWFAEAIETELDVTSLTAEYSGTIPAEWPVNARQTYSITVVNNSLKTWKSTGAERVRLEAAFAGQPPVLSDLPTDVLPGGSATLTLSMKAPVIAGATTLTHRLLLATGRRFEDASITNATIGSLDATYVATPPTLWQPGQTRTFNVTITNTGTSLWRTTGNNPTRLGVYFSGNSDALHDWSSEPQRVSLTRDVLPGESITLAVTTAAPTAADVYVLRLRMVTENASWFTPLHKTTVDVGTLNASYEASPPTTWINGRSQTFSVVVTNIGTAAWRASGANNVRLGSYFGAASDAIGAWAGEPRRVSLPNDVLPGESVTLSVTATAPTSGTTDTLRLRMVGEGTAWFTPLHKTAVTLQTLAASYIATVPTNFTRNQLQTFSISLTNTGTATWNATGTNPVRLAYYFFGQSDAANDWTVEPTRIELPRDILPGETVSFNISVRAPNTAGVYPLRLRMVKENVQWFNTLLPTTVTVS